MSQETLQVQQNGQLVDQDLRQKASELEQRDSSIRVAEDALLSWMEQEEDENGIIGGSIAGKTTLGKLVFRN